MVEVYIGKFKVVNNIKFFIMIIIIMYCVCQIESKSGTRQVIEIIQKADDFSKVIKDKLNEKHNFKCLNNITIANINSKEYSVGHYLLQITNKFYFVEKSRHISLGYLFNSSYDSVTLIYEFECIPYVFNPPVKDVGTKSMAESKQESSIDMDMSTVEDSLTETEDYNEPCFELFKCNLKDLNSYPCNIYIGSNKNTERNKLISSILDVHITSSMLIISENNHDYYKKQYQYAEVLKTFDFAAVNDYFFHHDENIYIVLDCPFEMSEKVKNLMDSAEEFNITIIITNNSEYYRDHLDFLFFNVNENLREHDMQQMFKVCDDIFPTFEIFKQFYYDELVENYLVVSKRGIDNVNPVAYYNH